jgi:hypothetical protein
VSWERVSQLSANPTIQPIVNEPARCTRRACRIVRGEAKSQAIVRKTIAARTAESPSMTCFPHRQTCGWCSV